jgi:hypothetical protein
MPHNTKQMICHWYLDGFKPESPYYHDIREHFKESDLARIDEILKSEYNPNAVLTHSDLNFVMRVLKEVLKTSVPGAQGGKPDDEYPE